MIGIVEKTMPIVFNSGPNPNRTGAAYPLGAYGSVCAKRAFMPVFSSVLCAVLPFSVSFGIGCAVLIGKVGRLEEISVYDQTTGLRSGRLFESGVRSSVVGLSPVAVLLVDLDDFRRYNRGGYRGRRSSAHAGGACAV